MQTARRSETILTWGAAQRLAVASVALAALWALVWWAVG